MKNIAAQMVNFDREQMRRIANNMPEQYDEKPQVQQVAQIINGVFSQLLATFPASLANRDQNELNEIRRQWVLAFRENGITTMEQVNAGKAEKAAEKKRRREEQKQKDKLKIQKLALKPRSYWIKQAQQAVNAFIRERDRDLPCISCGTLTSAQWDAGHYRTTAAAPQLRFDERNIHKQCVVCNQHKSGNLVPYRVELISRIGQEAVDEIESNHNRHRWTIGEIPWRGKA
ncbi:replication protein P [Escherichia coli]|uniref:replication protein P n=4 Tax=Enterobacteriaceae TaxID=543 RepID=UPI0030D4CB94